MPQASASSAASPDITFLLLLSTAIRKKFVSDCLRYAKESPVCRTVEFARAENSGY